MLKGHILALDFDGTCWDSIDERFYTASRAYQRVFQMDCSASQACFREGTCRAAGAADFLWIMRLALENPQRNWEDLSEPQVARLKHSLASEMVAFEQVFYQVRAEEQSSDFAKWASLQRPFPAMLAQFSELTAAFRAVVVATAKDAQSASRLLASVGVEVPIWGREHGIEKGPQILALCREYASQPDQVLFIDDFMENLRSASEVGARCFLAGWGYNTDPERRRAPLEGFPVLHSTGLVSQLEAWKISQSQKQLGALS